MKRTLALSMFALVIVATAVTLVELPRAQTRNTVSEGELPVQEPQTADDPLESASHPCPWSQKGGHPGNNHASCESLCKSTDLLTIHAHSADTVEVTANGVCGNAVASCSGETDCVGTSRKMAGSQSTATCGAESDEWWASALTVDCAGTPSETCPAVIGCQTEDSGSETE